MLYANYHTHTVRCGHARGEEREYVENAIASGMKVLGFSDHIPCVFPDGSQSGYRMKAERLEDYVSTLLSLKEEYKNDITILIGYEMEYYPQFFDGMLRRVCAYPIDYVIMGQHFLENELTHLYSGSIGDSERLLSMYVSQVLEGLRTGVFTYLAHPDLPNFTGDENIYRREMRRLCEGTKALGIPLEINFLGIADGRHYPCHRFFSIAEEVGNDIILGCDAHYPELISDPGVRAKAQEFCDVHHFVPLREAALHDPKLYFQKNNK